MNRIKMINILIFGLLIARAQGVLNKKEAQKRDAPFDTYGPPPIGNIDLPLPVYGVPDGPVAKYPPPPPDVPPPPPSQQYGVPILKYGPPKVNIEYGPPKFKPQFHQKVHYHGPPKEASFFDQIKSTFGFGGGPSPSYGPPLQQHKQHFSHPKITYGPPKGLGQQHFSNSFGGSSFGGSSFGSSSFGGSSFGSGSFGGGSHGGGSLGGASFGGGSSSFSSHSIAPIQPPPVSYGAPQKLGPQFPNNPDIRCDGWKPIPGPAIQPDQSYGPPAIGGGYQSGSVNLESHAHNDVQFIENHGHGHSLDQAIVQVQEPIFELPKLETAQPFHAEINSIGHNDINLLKTNSFEISSNSLSDSYGPPPSGLVGSGGFNHGSASISTSYGPPALPEPYGPPPLPIQTYGPPKVNHHIHIPSSGLLPPSGVYGVPPGGSYHGLAISHGSVSGNLKPWPVQGSAPKRPLSNRPPVPNGLLESIGHKVKHLDQTSFKFNQHNNIYLPPQVNDIPPPPHGLNSLPLDSPARPFLTQHNTLPQALPLIQEPRGVINDCGHGPSFQQQVLQPPIQDSYGPPPSGNIFSSGGSIGQSFGRVQSSLHTTYQGPSIGNFGDLPVGHIPHETYGVPKFNNFDHGGDSFAFGSQIKSETVSVTGEKINNQAKSNTIVSVEKEKKVEDNDEERTKKDVVGLTGLNVISAQKSQSITIPVQGARGNYQLQFQSADPNGQPGAPHEQLLTEGLLQQILSAIEQPGSGNSEGVPQAISIQNSQNIPQVSKEQHEDHDEVKIFLKSPQGEEVIKTPEMN